MTNSTNFRIFSRGLRSFAASARVSVAGATRTTLPARSAHGRARSSGPAGCRGRMPAWHLPLLRGEDGRRLAKRHGDSRIGRWRKQSPNRLIGLLACWSGITPTPEPMSAAAFADAFDVERLPKDDVVVTEADLTWLD